MKKTRVKLDSENSLLVRGKRGISIYEVFYDSCVLVESEDASQEYCVMIFYNDDNLLLQTVVNKETIEEKFRWILNKGLIEIYSEELVYVNSSSPKVKPLQSLIRDDFMKKISSLPKECELSINVTIYKHTALKLNKPTLIIGKKDNLKEIVYYISFGDMIDKTNTNFIKTIMYYDKSGCSFFSDYYRLEDEDYVLHTLFVQLIERVVQIN